VAYLNVGTSFAFFLSKGTSILIPHSTSDGRQVKSITFSRITARVATRGFLTIQLGYFRHMKGDFLTFRTAANFLNNFKRANTLQKNSNRLFNSALHT
jgi:hypothetical protein